MRHWQGWVAILLIGVVILTAGCAIRRRMDHWPCVSGINPNTGQPIYTTCWGFRSAVHFAQASVVEAAQTFDYPTSQFVSVVPEEANVNPAWGEGGIEYFADHQAHSYASPMAYDSLHTEILTAGKNDGRTWHVMSMSGSESEYDAWLADRDEKDILDAYSLVIAADWGPAAAGCATFDSFDVDLFEQRNLIEGLRYIDTVPTSYAETLAARLLGPIEAAPASSFVPPKAREDLSDTIHEVQEFAEKRSLGDAAFILQAKVIDRVDGVIGGDPSNDIVDDPVLQQALIDAANGFIADLHAAEEACKL